MYYYGIPLMNHTLDRSNKQKIVENFKKAGAKRVFLSIDSYESDEEKRDKIFASLKENLDYFRRNGFEVAVWLWTFMLKAEKGYRRIVGIDGRSSQEFCCPTDENFVKFACDYLQGIAKLNPDLILFDDDYRFDHLDCGIGCLCENHLKDIGNRLGEEMDIATFAQKAFTGGRNKYRDAYMQSMGDSLKNFAKSVRKSVDQVNPNVRVGLCACISTWDGFGTDAIEISKLLAGNTKPYLRQIGAPYWAVHHNWGNKMSSVIELERMQATWSKNKGVEVVAEGDVFPRPRYTCPASYLENFDLAMIADGNLDGIMKYMMDYYASERHETGYLEAHDRNQELRTQVANLFSEKEAVGVRVYENQHKLENFDFSLYENYLERIENLLFSPATKFIIENSLPVTYEGEGVGIAFGENARNLPKSAYRNGLILDVAAARILTEQGVDVGLNCKFSDFATIKPQTCNLAYEYFARENEYIRTEINVVYPYPLKDNVNVQSKFIGESGQEYVSSYTYVNGEGDKFLVFMVDAFAGFPEIYYRNYTRQTQLTSAIEWFSGEKPLVTCNGHPDLYMLCKRSGNKLSVGMFNFSPDAIYEPAVEINSDILSVVFIHADGKCNGRTVTLNKLCAFEFAGFEITLK